MPILLVLAALAVSLFFKQRVIFVVFFVMLFALIAGQRVMGDMTVAVGYDFEGEDVLRTTESCGSALSLLTGNESLPNGIRNECERSANTRVFEALGALVLGAGGAWVAWRLIPNLSPTPIDEVLNPLPDRTDYYDDPPERIRSDKRA